MTGYRSELAALLSLCFSAHIGRRVLSTRCLGKGGLESPCDVTVHGVLTSVVVVMMSFALAKSAGIPMRPKNGSIIRRRS